MTLLRKISILFCVCLAASLIVSCAGTTPPPLATTAGLQATQYAEVPDPAPLATLGPEIKRFSGTGNSAETTIKLDGKQILRVNWSQNCINSFYLSLVNADAALANQDGSEIILSIAAGPSYGYSDYEFEPGTYKINIESDGSWEVWVETVVQLQEVESTE